VAGWLEGFCVGIPIVGAVVVWLIGAENSRIRFVVATVSAGATGLAALMLLLWPSEGLLATVLAGSTDVIILIGTGIILAVGWGLATRFALNYRWQGQAASRIYYAMLLLTTAGWAGVVLVDNLILWLASWALLFACPFLLLRRDRG
jgi:NADH:ubiquinone oxidoreductase subunit 2 (subunit N)